MNPEEEHTPASEYALMLLSVGAAIGGWSWRVRLYGKAAQGLQRADRSRSTSAV